MPQLRTAADDLAENDAAIRAEAGALGDPHAPDLVAGRGRFAATVHAILAERPDAEPTEARYQAVATAASIFLHAGWRPVHVVGFAATHVPGTDIADTWPHDAGCWCVPCLFAHAVVDGDDPAAEFRDATPDVLRRLADADIDAAYVFQPGPGTPHAVIPVGSVYLTDAYGQVPMIPSPMPYTVGIAFADGRDELIVWQGEGYEAAVDAMIAVIRAARVVGGR